ncbi:hypothetical protein [Candidatus Nitrospira bockiana]
MSMLEVFVHTGCLSHAAVEALTRQVQALHPDLTIRIRSLVDSKDRADVLGILITPAFVLNGRIIAVGVPRGEWLMRKLCEAGLDQEGGCS